MAIKAEWMRQVYNVEEESLGRLNVGLPYVKAIVWQNTDGLDPGMNIAVDYRVSGNSEVRMLYNKALSHSYFIKGREIKEGFLSKKYAIGEL